MSKGNIKLSGVSQDPDQKFVSGWAQGRNGWRLEFNVSPGVIDIDTRETTDYAAKADARQIKRELKKIFSATFNGVH